MNDTTALLAAIGGLREDIGGLRADVRHIMIRQDEMKEQLADHTAEDRSVERRVRSIEKSRSRLMGVAAGVSAATTVMVATAAYALQFFPLR